MENATKKWWQSKGVNGALLAIAGTVGGFFGLSVDDALVHDAATLGEQAYAVAMQAITVGGAALALWGRLRATKPIQ